MRQMCDRLNVKESTVKSLVKKGYLVKIGETFGARYLDPTDDYAERLKISEMKLGSIDIPPDMESKYLLTALEFSILSGRTPAGARNYLMKHKVPHIKCGKFYLYRVSDIRHSFAKRRQRLLAERYSPFLVQEIIEYFLRVDEEMTAAEPTDEQYRRDEIFKKKIKTLMKKSGEQKEAALNDFFSKVQIAKDFLSLMQEHQKQKKVAQSTETGCF